MLKFYKSTGFMVTSFILGEATPELAPSALATIETCVIDGAEKKMLARARIAFPKVHGPVILPRESALMVAYNLPAIVAKYGKMPPVVGMVANDDEPSEDDE